MKSFERLVLFHLKAITDPPAYRANRSVDDAVNMALHFILQHLDSTGTYARILFVELCLQHHHSGTATRQALPAECAWLHLYTNSCTSSHQSVKLLKFADRMWSPSASWAPSSSRLRLASSSRGLNLTKIKLDHLALMMLEFFSIAV